MLEACTSDTGRIYTGSEKSESRTISGSVTNQNSLNMTLNALDFQSLQKVLKQALLIYDVIE
jgi:hypothetical protein